MSASKSVEQEVGKQVIDYISKTPQAIAVLFCSFISGQLWAFIIMAYYRKSQRGNFLLKTIPGRTSLGFAWFTMVMVPIYLYSYGICNFDYLKILDLTVPTIVIGLFTQLICFALHVRRGK